MLRKPQLATEKVRRHGREAFPKDLRRRRPLRPKEVDGVLVGARLQPEIRVGSGRVAGAPSRRAARQPTRASHGCRLATVPLLWRRHPRLFDSGPAYGLGAAGEAAPNSE